MSLLRCDSKLEARVDFVLRPKRVTFELHRQSTDEPETREDLAAAYCFPTSPGPRSAGWLKSLINLRCPMNLKMKAVEEVLGRGNRACVRRECPLGDRGLGSCVAQQRTQAPSTMC